MNLLDKNYYTVTVGEIHHKDGENHVLFLLEETSLPLHLNLNRLFWRPQSQGVYCNITSVSINLYLQLVKRVEG